MAITEFHTNGTREGSKNPDHFLPGTTFPEKLATLPTSPNTHNPGEPLEFAGPEVNGKSTIVTLFSPLQLAKSSFVPSLYKVINEAYDEGHVIKNVTLVAVKRLRYDSQLFEELGNAPGTFTYILSYSGTHDVLATGSAKRYMGRVHVAEKNLTDETRRAITWRRTGLVPAGTAAWELATLAVDPKLQRRGLAGFLMKIIEDEIKRNFKLAVQAAEGDEKPNRLVMMLTTLKERNYDFYVRKGYALDYETKFGPEWFGSTNGFTVANMSRSVDFDELPENSGSH